MCTLKISKAVIKQIDKFRKNCLWRGNNVNGRGQLKAAWKLICRTKDEGGLGIINLETQNQARLMKNLDKFFHKKDIPWVSLVWEKHYRNDRLPGEVKKGSFWWSDVLKLIHKFKESAEVQVKKWENMLVLEGPMVLATTLRTISSSSLICKEQICYRSHSLCTRILQ
jgi:hypothetical protein